MIFPTLVGPVQTVPGGSGITSKQIADIQLYANGNDLQGDYNGDGAVNAADYAIWRKQIGFAGVGINSDGDSNGVVDAMDYVLWRKHTAFGSGRAAVAGSGAGAHVWPAYRSRNGEGAGGLRRSRRRTAITCLWLVQAKN